MQKRLFFFLSLLFVLFAYPVISIGLSPATTHVAYVPGSSETFSFYILNTRGEDIDAHLYATGEYASLITFPEKVVTIPKDQTREVQATITFPESILTPGPQHIKIGVIENPIEERATQGVVPKVGVEMKVKFDIPYPGKYLQFRLEVPLINTGEKLPVYLHLKSFGKEVVEHMTGTITLSTTEKDYYALPVSLEKIQPEEERLINNLLPTNDFPPGDYQATGTFTYDGLAGFAETDFRIGSLFVNLTNMTLTFERGTIAPVELHIASRWNKNIDDVYATIDISQNNKLVTSLKTPSISLSPWETSILRAYWDTHERERGNYDTTITLHYTGTTTTFQKTFTVYETLKISTTPILIGIIIFIILVDLLWLLRKKKSSP